MLLLSLSRPLPRAARFLVHDPQAETNSRNLPGRFHGQRQVHGRPRAGRRAGLERSSIWTRRSSASRNHHRLHFRKPREDRFPANRNRGAEAFVCARCNAAGRSVISLGGGAFLDEENLDLVLNNGVSVWLDCPLPVIERRIAGFSPSPAGARSEPAAQPLRNAPRRLRPRRLPHRN